MAIKTYFDKKTNEMKNKSGAESTMRKLKMETISILET